MIFCVLNMKQQRKGKRAQRGEESDAWHTTTVYGVCAHLNCKHFKLIINSESLKNGSREVKVFSCSCELKLLEEFIRYLNGHGRIHTQKVLCHTKPGKYITNENMQADNGNLQSVRLKCVIANARQ